MTTENEKTAATKSVTITMPNYVELWTAGMSAWASMALAPMALTMNIYQQSIRDLTKAGRKTTTEE
jgi:hypothetical protein